MSFKGAARSDGVEWAIGSAARSLLVRNAELTPANLLAELATRSSESTAEATRLKAAIAWLQKRIN